MKYVVTGGAGFIGSHLADRLIADGHDVVIIDNLLLGKKEFINPAADFRKVDLRDLDGLQEAMKGADGVFHLAADPRLPVSIEDPHETHDVNVTGTLNVLIAAKDNKVKKVVFSSTCALYEDNQTLPLSESARINPESPYGLHKKMGEDYMRLFHKLYGLETVSLRYFNVFGPRKTADGGYPMVIPIFMKQRVDGQAMTIVGDGEQTRDYVHVSDVVEANIKAMESNIVDGTAYNIGSGCQVSVNKIAEIIGGDTSNLPQRAGEMRFIEADSKKAESELGWKAQKDFAEGIEELKQLAGIS